jgi:hypothetical protein
MFKEPIIVNDAVRLADILRRYYGARVSLKKEVNDAGIVFIRSVDVKMLMGVSYNVSMQQQGAFFYRPKEILLDDDTMGDAFIDIINCLSDFNKQPLIPAYAKDHDGVVYAFCGFGSLYVFTLN